MNIDDLKEEYQHLIQEVKVGSIAEHDFEVTEFFRIYAAIAAENGDTPDLEYSPILYQGSPRHRVDGYAFDIIEAAGSESGDLYLVVCDYYQDEEMPSVNASRIDKSVDMVERFLKRIGDSSYLNKLEEEDPEYQLGLLINQYYTRIKRIRVVIFTNGHLKVRKNIFETRTIGEITLHINVLDLERYVKISNTGSEPIVVDFKNDFDVEIPYLTPSTGTDSYSAYLFVIPGVVLAQIFAAFGNRLLEQNVRTYLQARTNVNKGILKTITEEPGMFLAYNNGITATASDVEFSDSGNDDQVIENIHNFQIVNGGQTTASLLYARDSLNYDLSNVYVQVKLSVITADRLESVVPKISEYANTQNKVSLADLAANSPAQIQIERLSRDILPPQKVGRLHCEKWFYERSRGQYKSLFAYKSAAERKKLDLEYPKKQLIVKTDLAKYEYSFDGKPHIVSLGAQKCFLKYTDDLSKIVSGGSALNAVWYRRAVAKAILFIGLDNAVQKSAWYLSDRGYKAQIVTYTIAACAAGFRAKGTQFNLDKVWELQEVPADFMTWMVLEARKVGNILKNPPPEFRNISEYAKKEICWDRHISGKAGIPSTDIFTQYGISVADFNNVYGAGVRDQARNNKVDIDVSIAALVPQARELRQKIESQGYSSPKNISALGKLESGNINLNKGEKNALKSALERIGIELGTKAK